MSKSRILKIEEKVESCVMCLLHEHNLWIGHECNHPNCKFKKCKIPEYTGAFPDGCPLEVEREISESEKERDSHEKGDF